MTESQEGFYLGQASIDNNGLMYIYLYGGLWQEDSIKKTAIYVCKQESLHPQVDGRKIAYNVTIERDEYQGAFTNMCGIPLAVKELFKQNTNTRRLFAKV